MSEQTHQAVDAEAEVERVLALVWTLFSAVVAAVIVSWEIAEQRFPGSAAALAAVAIVPWVIAAPIVAGRIRRRGKDRVILAGLRVAMQLFGTTVIVGQVMLLDAVIPAVAWTALVIPILAAGQRFASREILLSLLAVVALYLGALSVPSLSPDGPAFDSALTAQRVGVLALIAAVVAVLAEWLAGGWREQAEERVKIDERIDRLRIVEHNGRLMRQPEAEIMMVALNTLIQLGFVAVTAASQTAVEHLVGDQAVLEGLGVPTRPVGNQLEVTRWVAADERAIYSVAMFESGSDRTISAWSHHPVDPAMARLVGDVVIQTTSAFEVAALHLDPALKPIDGPTPQAGPDALDLKIDEVGAATGSVAVMLVRVDQLAAIRGSYGQAAGPAVLDALEQRLEEAIGEEGFVTRRGEDEFGVVLRGKAATVVADFAPHLAEYLGQAIELPTFRVKPAVNIGSANGIGPLDPHVLRHKAHRALFEAAGSGPGRCRSLTYGPPPPTHRRSLVRASYES